MFRQPNVLADHRGGGQAMGKIPGSRDGRWRSLIRGVALLLTALSGIDMAPKPSREADQSATPFKRIQVGEVAPDFTLRTPDGSSHRLSELRGRKNLVLI